MKVRYKVQRFNHVLFSVFTSSHSDTKLNYPKLSKLTQYEKVGSNETKVEREDNFGSTLQNITYMVVNELSVLFNIDEINGMLEFFRESEEENIITAVSKQFNL